ncbi:protein PRRC2A-like [Triticum urartu]|uniref:protein PRRC2A-like n=1 Tax=Triticum urartu TaxID=4572 RepID=UPI0020432A13|nr:protein PRRC2A-like [Triticum urartu]
MGGPDADPIDPIDPSALSPIDPSALPPIDGAISSKFDPADRRPRALVGVTGSGDGTWALVGAAVSGDPNFPGHVFGLYKDTTAVDEELSPTFLRLFDDWNAREELAIAKRKKEGKSTGSTTTTTTPTTPLPPRPPVPARTPSLMSESPPPPTPTTLRPRRLPPQPRRLPPWKPRRGA